MANKEKIISGLEFHMKGLCNEPGGKICPYWRQDECSFALAADVLAMIEEYDQATENLNKTIRSLLQQIKDMSEYMTPYGKAKDVKAANDLLKEQEQQIAKLKKSNEFLKGKTDNLMYNLQAVLSEMSD